MKYLSKFPPCFQDSRQNRRNYTEGQDPSAEETVAATDWIGVICLLLSLAQIQSGGSAGTKKKSKALARKTIANVQSEACK